MRRNQTYRARVIALSLLAFVAGAAVAVPPTPLGTDFTYQGRVTQGGAPLTGTADVRFTLFNDGAAGVAVAAPLQVNNVLVANGVFSTTLDFGGDVFNGEARWLEIEVRSPAGVGAFQKLTPREPVSAIPYALQTRGLFTDANLRVGVGTTTPLERLNVKGNLRTDGGELKMFTGAGAPAMFTLGSGQILVNVNPGTGVSTSAIGTSVDGSGFIELYSKDGPLTALLEGDLPTTAGVQTGALRVRSVGTGGGGGQVVVQNNDAKDTIQMVGGASAASSTLSLLNASTQVTVRATGDVGGNGGEIRTTNGAGNYQSIIQPDINSGGGVFVFLARNATSDGLMFDGNFGGTGNPRLDIFGSNPVTINTNAAGDASVVLPVNAISSSEILDEPGVANIHSNSVALGSTIAAVASRSITVPAAGYVLAIAQGDLQVIHAAGNGLNCTYGVSTSATSLPGDQDVQTQFPAALAAGTYDFSASAHGLFQVAAGTSTFFFSGTKGSSADTATMFDIQLTLVYFPTAYGTVQSNLEIGPGSGDRGVLRPPLSADEIAAEQDEELDAAKARADAELSQMQARINELQAHLDDLRREQNVGKTPAVPAVRPAAPNVNIRAVSGAR